MREGIPVDLKSSQRSARFVNPSDTRSKACNRVARDQRRGSEKTGEGEGDKQRPLRCCNSTIRFDSQVSVNEET